MSEGVIAAHRVADLCEIACYIGEAERRPLVERMRQVEAQLAQLKGKG
jgi:hypothetical protein